MAPSTPVLWRESPNSFIADEESLIVTEALVKF
jgi:hypothetical protein